jgi:small conductance mechanosensitive channel
MQIQLFQRGDWVAVAIWLTAVVIVAFGAAELAARLARTILLAITQSDQHVPFSSPIIRRPIRIVRAMVFLLSVSVLLLPALSMAGVDTPDGASPLSIGVWFFSSGLRIALIAVLCYLLLRIAAVMTHRLEEELGRRPAPDVAEHLKRARTISKLVQNALTIAVSSLGVLMVLRELNVDIMPILTGAGILGLAVGFGAQTLVKDLISGLFLTLENQVRVGDVVRIAGTGGFVEAINLRTVVLRDVDGAVHIFPNGSIDRLTNLTKDYSYAVVDVGVAYKEDVDRVFDVLRGAGSDLAADPRFAGAVLEPLEVLGVEAFAESQITIKVRMRTVPLKQFEVGRELRRRIKNVFDAQGIEIPFPHVSLYVSESGKPRRPARTPSDTNL